MESEEIGWGFDWIAVVQDRDRWWSCCECGNELSGCIKCEEFLDWLRNCQLLKQHSVIT